MFADGGGQFGCRFFDSFDIQGILDGFQAGGDFGEDFLGLRICCDLRGGWYRAPDQIIFFEDCGPLVEIAGGHYFVDSADQLRGVFLARLCGREARIVVDFVEAERVA